MQRRRAIVLVAVTLAAASTGWVSAAGVSTEAVESTLDGLRGETGTRAITFVGTFADRPDVAALGLGRSGSWFPQFDRAEPVESAPTGENALDAVPAWVAAFNHTTSPADPGCVEPGALERGCMPSYYFRTFSQDGPARSAGGQIGWSTVRLPSGTCGLTGAIVDPHTYVAEQDFDDPTGLLAPRTGEPKPNNNNTINRIQLRDGVPATFFVSVLTDNTAGEHDPGRLELRGNAGWLDVPSEIADSQIEPTFPTPIGLIANGVPDVHVFRVQGFSAGDYLKLRLRGTASAAGFGGLLFDSTLTDIAPDSGTVLECP